MTTEEFKNFYNKREKEEGYVFSHSGVSLEPIIKDYIKNYYNKKITNTSQIVETIELLIQKTESKKKDDKLFSLDFHMQLSSVLNLFFKDFLYITPSGRIIKSIFGFYEGYILGQKLPPIKTMDEYIKTMEKYNQFKNPEELINITSKLQKTFGDNCSINQAFACEFYAIERFGKTRIGQLLLHGKQTQNLRAIEEVCASTRIKILDFVNKNKIQAIVFVPPTTPRQLQFMDYWQKNLNINLPVVKFEKKIYDIPVQQKTLKSKEHRMENAMETMFLVKNPDILSYERILIFDDAVASGSTFQALGLKLREAGIAKDQIYVLAITVTANGIIDDSQKFEVVNEV